MEPGNIRSQVCRRLHISPPTYGAILHKYMLERAPYVSGSGVTGHLGNTESNNTRIPRTKGLQTAVQNRVRKRRQRKERVTARQVLDYFVHENHLVVKVVRDGNEGVVTYDAKTLKLLFGMSSAGYNGLVIVKGRHQFLREFLPTEHCRKGSRKGKCS